MTNSINKKAKLFKSNRFGCYCFYCKRELNLSSNKGKCDEDDYVTLDHFIPKSLTNPNSRKENLVISCAACNNLKEDMIVRGLKLDKIIRYMEKHKEDCLKYKVIKRRQK